MNNENDHLDESRLYVWAVEPEKGTAFEKTHVQKCTQCRDALALLSSIHAEVADCAPSLFETRRMERELDALLDKEVSDQRRAWRPIQVVAALAIASFSGASLAYVAFNATHQVEQNISLEQKAEERPSDAMSASSPPKRNNSERGLFSEVVSEVHFDAEEKVPSLRSKSVVKKKPKIRKESPRERTIRLASEYEDQSCKVAMIDVADKLELERDFSKAAKLYSGALCSVRGQEAAQKLQTQVRRGDVDAILVSEMIRQNAAAKASIEGARLLCEWGLKYRKNSLALHDCSNFLERHPDAQRAQLLSFAAGRVSARSLKDKQSALAFFTFSIEHQGDDFTRDAALFERAKAFAHLKRYAEADEDLSLYRRRVAPELRREGYDALERMLAQKR